MKFRIKKVVRKNGNVEYYPQYKIVFRWKNILDHYNFYITTYCNNRKSKYYLTKNDCIECIECFKDYIKSLENQKIINTLYIYLK